MKEMVDGFLVGLGGGLWHGIPPIGRGRAGAAGLVTESHTARGAGGVLFQPQPQTRAEECRYMDNSELMLNII